MDKTTATAKRKAISGELLQVHAAAEFAGWSLKTIGDGDKGEQVWTYRPATREGDQSRTVAVHILPGKLGTVVRVVTRKASSDYASEARRQDFDTMGAFEFVYPAFGTS